MEKSRDAFRTISEVAEWLDVPTHVLRFWESRFSQIKPVKRAGGRRYYRPSDMKVIGGVKTLLHDQGMTIRAVQKLFREQGIKHVSSFSPGLYVEDVVEDTDDDVIDHQPAATTDDVAPAPSARSTHDATPAQVEEAVEVEDPGEQTPLFSHRRRPAEAESTPEPDAAPGEEPEEVEAAVEPASGAQQTLDLESSEGPEIEAIPKPAPSSIPPTPDVPDTDALDDDASHEAGPGMAARILTARKSQLRSQKETLSDVTAKLKEIRERLN